MKEWEPDAGQSGLKQRLWEIIFEAETPSGKAFDVALLWIIAASVLVVMLESVDSLRADYGGLFYTLEWIFTVLFTLEYGLRLWLVRRPRRYAFSFFGIVDFLSCLPTYLALFLPGVQSLLVIRILRLLRMFRVLKMVSHVQGANLLTRSIYASRAKITVFLTAMATFAAIMGTLAYLFEHEEGGGFASIPDGIYWAVVTMTTLGYGDITPVTVMGKVLTVIVSLSGFAVIAVPTGIFVTEVARAMEKEEDFTEACPGCGTSGHLPDANFCRKCGEKLDF
ncbi:ion transporter [Roseibacillus ishigakijimensis]|uniref:Ion transporter n=1 Tax=Roseibacillus ishigakijimensis TaxID=454146 RepID=A0A934VMH4_9BACT|nr:ion transporter [Roseibacillus ishigakijimensis]MBK1834287.1 ion transporter [Roseibacillus ishigakijimensis]